MSTFSIHGKVALITGGTSGNGFYLAKELLSRNLKGVVLVGTNDTKGIKARDELIALFGTNKAIYFRADVSNNDQLDEAFKEGLKTYGNIDIVANAAGITNDALWHREIDINLVGTINGTFLGLEKYINNHKSGFEGVILNYASTAAIDPQSYIPIYSGTKGGVLLFSRSVGIPEQYAKNKVRVITICPGRTSTPGMDREVTYGPFYDQLKKKYLAAHPIVQSPKYLAKAAAEIIVQGKNGSGWIVEDGKPPYEVLFPNYRECARQVLIIM